MANLLEIWVTVFTFDTLRYLFGAGLVSLVLFGLCPGFSRARRIQARKPQVVDYLREVGYSLLTTGVYATVALVTIRLERAGVLLVYDDWRDYGWVYGAVSLPALLVLHDAYFYWVHRAMHHRWLFRRFHLVHHRSRTPTPWAAYAFAPGEAFLMALFVPAVTWFLPVHEVVMFVFLAIMILRNAMGHSGVEFHPHWWVDSPLDCLTSVVHHDLHHQRARGNYGLYFTWWDRWMGTEFADYKARFRQAVRPSLAEPELTV
ncbi:MAG: sterol desaturase family protein [Halieaceae bacterium]|jgi:sterol desaturase/sphingolipid hydroxylase (fatty acid hydroxylase superfamily)|nr:sterol desaturase family protein [Halieaceae bacterium]